MNSWYDRFLPGTQSKDIDLSTQLNQGTPPPALSKDEIETAYKIWAKRMPLERLDYEWLTYQPRAGCNWLRQVRSALQLSAEAVASKLGVSRQAFSRMEKAENDGNLTLKALHAAAEAMGCEVRYSLRPASGKCLSAELWAVLLPHALQSKSLAWCHPTRRAHHLANAAELLLEDSQFRKKMGWSRNRS